MKNAKCQMSNVKSMSNDQCPPAPEFCILHSPFWAACCLLLLFGLAQTAELTVDKSAGRIDIKLPFTTEQDYLLTGAEPLEFTVTGPAWVRVYSRLGWSDDLGISANYGLILTHAGQQRRESLSAEKSSGAIGPSHEHYAKWRSFYVKVPSGPQSYRLELGELAGTSVAVRFAFEAPPPYREITPEESLPVLSIADDSVPFDWRVTKSAQAVTLKVTGPARVRIDGRLLYPPGLLGVADMELSVSESGITIAARKFSVLRLKKARSLTARSGAPSVVHRLRISVPAGEHLLSVKFTSAKIAAGAMRFFAR
jgi:hypothetical protein